MGDRVDPAVAAIDQDGSIGWDRTSNGLRNAGGPVRGVLGVARLPASVLEAQFNFEHKNSETVMAEVKP